MQLLSSAGRSAQFFRQLSDTDYSFVENIVTVHDVPRCYYNGDDDDDAES